MADNEELYDFSKKPKKATKPKAKPAPEDPKLVPAPTVPQFKDPNTYEEMLERIMTILRNCNKGSSSSNKVNLPEIDMETEKKNKKYNWKNFGQFASQLNRPADHLRDFFSSQLGIPLNLINFMELKIEGRRTEVEELKTLIKKYVHEYVKCPHCNNTKTNMSKDPSLRMFVITCVDCKASRSLAAMRAPK